jgi:hypothetical protein
MQGDVKQFCVFPAAVEHCCTAYECVALQHLG